MEVRIVLLLMVWYHSDNVFQAVINTLNLRNFRLDIHREPLPILADPPPCGPNIAYLRCITTADMWHACPSTVHVDVFSLHGVTDQAQRYDGNGAASSSLPTSKRPETWRPDQLPPDDPTAAVGITGVDAAGNPMSLNQKRGVRRQMAYQRNRTVLPPNAQGVALSSTPGHAGVHRWGTMTSASVSVEYCETRQQPADGFTKSAAAASSRDHDPNGDAFACSHSDEADVPEDEYEV